MVSSLSLPLTMALRVRPSCAVPLIETEMLGVASITGPVVTLWVLPLLSSAVAVTVSVIFWPSSSSLTW